MANLDPELERRIRALENASEQGSGFTGADWLALIVLGIVLPIAMLIWGWPT